MEYKKKTLERVVGLQNKAKFITSGRSHTILIDEDLECYTWGSAVFGKLGHQDLVDQL